MLRDKPKYKVIEDISCVIWEVIQIGPEYKFITGFAGNDAHSQFYDVEEARQIAGDYTEFLNEKYLDKKVNEEWPPKDPELYYEYHMARAGYFAKKIFENALKDFKRD